MSNGRIGSANDGSSKPEHNPALDPRVVKTTARHIRVKWVRDAVIISLLVACLVYLVLTLGAVRDTQKGNVDKIDNSATAVQILKDCTANPDSDCAKRNARTTARALAAIADADKANTITVGAAIASCQADGITEQDALTRCAIARLPDE